MSDGDPRDLKPANANGLAELRSLLRAMGFELVPIGAAEMIAQAIRPVVREEIKRALAAIKLCSSPLCVTVDAEPDECERPELPPLDEHTRARAKKLARTIAAERNRP